MGKHKKKRKKTRRDTPEPALSIVEQAIDEKLAGEPEPERPEEQEPDTRNPAAAALSKLGASNGGKARASKLPAKEREAIAPQSGKWSMGQAQG